ncbi:MAG: hypothetical protein ACFBSG_20900 [Leptolyngbyaceae cyanobacterium]
MRDPLWRIKTLPWSALIQNALWTIALATVLDLGLLLMLVASLSVWPEGANMLLSGGILGSLLRLVAAGGVGALAVILMERLFGQVRLDAGTLWALVGCLSLGLWLKGFLPVPSLLVGISRMQFIGMMLGLFSQGRSYWRW